MIARNTLSVFTALLAAWLSTDAGAGPLVTVRDPATQILADGGSKHFGTIDVGATSTLTFSLANIGDANLVLGAPNPITISGANAADFIVVAQPASPVATDVSVANSGFDVPVLADGAWQEQPQSAGWTFTSTAGIARNGSPWFINAAPQGTQAAYLQMQDGAPSSMSQVLTFPDAGSYLIRFAAVRRGSFYPGANVAVRVDDDTLLEIPYSQQQGDHWREFTVAYNCITPGTHTLNFVTVGVLSDAATAIDAVRVERATSFKLRFAPTGPGLRTAQLAIASNDPTQNPFDLTLTGTAPSPAAQIGVEQPPGTPIANGPLVAWGSDLTVRAVPATVQYDPRNFALSGEGAVATAANGDAIGWTRAAAMPPVGLNGLKAIAGGGIHFVGLRADATIMAWGQNHQGQMTFPPDLDGVIAIDASMGNTVVLRSDGSVQVFGNNDNAQNPPPIAAMSGVKAIATEGYRVVALKHDGSIISWGGYSEVVHNTPAGITDLVAIAAGFSHTLGLRANGAIVAWGHNSNGELNIPPGLNDVVAVAAASATSMALTGDGRVHMWGFNSEGQANVPADLPLIQRVAMTDYASLGLGSPTVDFGALNVSAAATTRTIAIRNLSGTPLNLQNLAIVGAHAGEFTLDSSGLQTNLPASGSTTVIVGFDPSTGGDKRAKLRILSDDPDDARYDVALNGHALAPELRLADAVAGTTIVDGATIDFGTFNLGGHADRSFLLLNTGDAPLQLSGMQGATIVGNHAADFVVTSQPDQTIGGIQITGGGFEIPLLNPSTFAYAPSGTEWTHTASRTGVARNGSPWFVTPTPDGVQAAFVQSVFATDITLSRSFNFPLAGRYRISFAMARRGGVYEANDISVRVDGDEIGEVPNTALTDDAWHDFAFDYVCPSAGNHTLAFVGTRDGGDYATAIDRVAITGAATINVRFTPSAAGARVAMLSLPNNDVDEGSFALDLSGFARSADLRVSKTNFESGLLPGRSTLYTIQIENAGPTAVSAAHIVDDLPAALTNAQWTCTSLPPSPSLCPSGSGNGDIDQTTATLVAGALLEYSVIATPGGSVGAFVTNTVSVSNADGSDTVTSNDSATDTDPLVPEGIFANSFEHVGSALLAPPLSD